MFSECFIPDLKFQKKHAMTLNRNTWVKSGVQ
jgi:hypothetical protein